MWYGKCARLSLDEQQGWLFVVASVSALDAVSSTMAQAVVVLQASPRDEMRGGELAIGVEMCL